MSFLCTKCHAKTVVVYTKYIKDKNKIRRRRKCVACKHKFNTREIIHER
jgi:transcriptional regulator NrdR family protein